MVKATHFATLLVFALESVLCCAASSEAQSKGEEAPRLQSASLMQIGRVSQPIADAFVDPFATLEDEFDENELPGSQNKQPFTDGFPSIPDVFSVDSQLRSTWLPDPLMCSLAACCILAIVWFSSSTFRIDSKALVRAQQTLQAFKQCKEGNDCDSCEALKLGHSCKDASSDSEEEIACDSSSESEAEMIKQASQEACNAELRSALTSATQSRSPETEDSSVDRRISNWQTINQRLATALEDSAGCTELHMAVAENLPSATKRLLEQKADVNATDAWEETPLHFAARLNGSAEVCAHLLEHGATINAVNSDGETPVLLAARAGHAAACELLLARGGGVGGAVDDGELPPLLTALLARCVLSSAGC